jgi:hypothetical protein
MSRAPTKLTGRASNGFGAATENLRHCEPLIAARIGLPSVVSGTFNITLDEPFLIRADAALSALEYNGWEVILLQRCVIFGRAAVITRPHTHEIEPVPGSLYFGHGLAHLEVMAPFDIANNYGLSAGDRVEVEVFGDEDWWRRAQNGSWERRRASGMR